MPVGCLGNTSSTDQNDLRNHSISGSHLDEGGGNGNTNQPEMEVFITSSTLNGAEQFAFMQHTLLLQIFRQNIPNTKTENGNNASGYSSNGRQLQSPNGNKDSLSGSNSPNTFSNHSSLSSPSPSSSPLPTSLTNNCPTCVAFNDGQCCQNDNGLSLFQEFRMANIHCYWDGKLSDAIASLRFQGYVCPGILILISGSSQLELVVDAWQRRLLSSPPNCRICQVGLSNGCVVKPLVQSQTVSLPDLLCLVLSKMRQTQQIADIDSICSLVEKDWSSGVISRILTEGGKENLKDTIHSALGCLIKARKVYYTGNKGYFLVAAGSVTSQTINKDQLSPGQGGVCLDIPNNGSLGRLGSLSSQLRHSLRNRSTSWGRKSKSSPKMVDQECQTLLSDLPIKSPRINQNMNGTNPSNLTNGSASWSSKSIDHSPTLTTNFCSNQNEDDYDPLYAVPNHLGTKKQKNQENYNSPQTNILGNNSSSSPLHNMSIDTNSSYPLNSSKCSSPCSVPNTYRNFNLERSQSLRVSRKSQRSIASAASKGGSLRLSKKEAERLKELQNIDEYENITKSDNHQTNSRVNSPNNSSNSHPTLETEASSHISNEVNATPTNKSEPKNSSFERKNSFLGKLFGGSGGGKKKTSGSSAGSEKSLASTASTKKDIKTDKPKIKTFSAQFPPPELIELSNPIYTALIRKPQPVQDDLAEKETNNVENTKPQGATSSSLSHHQGPNGNFVIYEKSGDVLNHSYEQPNAPGLNSHGVNDCSVTVYGCQTQNISVSNNGKRDVYEYASVGSMNMSGGLTAGPQAYKKQLPQIPSSSNGLPRLRMPMSSNIYSSPENYYSNPPPPLPYRPPPPNPYLSLPHTQHSNLNKQSPNGRNDIAPYPSHNSQSNQIFSNPRSQNNSYQQVKTSFSSPPYTLNTNQINGVKSPNQSILSSVSQNNILSNNRSSNNNKSGTIRNVRFADENTPTVVSSSADSTITTTFIDNSNENSSSNGSTQEGSSSGPSSMESQTTRPLFDKTLVVIERSNNELELNLNQGNKYNNHLNGGSSLSNAKTTIKPNTNPNESSHALLVSKILSQPPQTLPGNGYVGRIGRQMRNVDTIHNNRNLLSPEEIIYEIDSINISDSDLSPNLKVHDNNGNKNNNSASNDNSYMRSPSKTTKVKPMSMVIDDCTPSASSPSAAPSYPSLSDLSVVNDVNCANFKSLTAQKLMAGLSFNSIDTLLEVNAAAEARNKLNESTETVDFGVI